MGTACPAPDLHSSVSYLGDKLVATFPFLMQKLLYFIKVTFVSPRQVWGLLRGGASAEPCLLHLPAFPIHAKKAASKPGLRQTAHVSGSVLSAADISLACAKSCCTLFQAGKSGFCFFLIFCLNPSIRLHLHTNSDPRYWALLGPYVCLCFKSSWVFWTSRLAFQLRLFLPASLNPPHVDLRYKNLALPLANWAPFLNALSFISLICKMGIIMALL